jgi:hypothetical protein
VIEAESRSPAWSLHQCLQQSGDVDKRVTHQQEPEYDRIKKSTQMRANIKLNTTMKHWKSVSMTHMVMMGAIRSRLPRRMPHSLMHTVRIRARRGSPLALATEKKRKNGMISSLATACSSRGAPEKKILKIQ